MMAGTPIRCGTENRRTSYASGVPAVPVAERLRRGGAPRDGRLPPPAALGIDGVAGLGGLLRPAQGMGGLPQWPGSA